jgi:hypothetical protein
MRDVVAENFGLAIAFLCPGLLVLVGLSFFNDPLAQGLRTVASADSSLGGFVFIVVASAGLGVFISNARYFLFDRGLLKVPLLGVPDPAPDSGVVRRVGDRAAAWDVLRDQFYRYYQFSSNTAVALALVFVSWWWKTGHIPAIRLVVAFGVAELVLVAGAVDTIKKYRTRTNHLTESEPLIKMAEADR